MFYFTYFFKLSKNIENQTKILYNIIIQETLLIMSKDTLAHQAHLFGVFCSGKEIESEEIR